MKRSSMTPAISRISGVLIFAMLTCGVAVRLGAAEYVFGTGSTMPTLSAGDTVRISGNGGVVTLSDSTSITVSDQAQTEASFVVGANGDVTFMPDKASGGWALLQASGATSLISVNAAISGTNIINLDKVILQGDSGARLMTMGNGGADNVLQIKGEVIFKDATVTTQGGAFVLDRGMVVFDDKVIFDSNSATTGGAFGSSGAAPSTVYFKSGAKFINNIANSGGGAIATLLTTSGRAITLNMDDAAALEFYNNRTVTGNGGAIANGGSTDNGVYINGGNLYMKDNSAAGQGGSIRSSVGIYIKTGDFLFFNNQSGDHGGVFTANNLELRGSGSLAGNMSGANGGAYYGNASTTIVDMESTADNIVFDGNIAGGLGGVFYLGGASASLRLTATSAGDIIFKNNISGATLDGAAGSFTHSGGSANAVHFNGATASLVLNAGAGSSIEFYDPISMASGILTVTKSGSGTAKFASYHSNIAANTTVSEGAFHLSDGAIYGSAGAGTFTLASGATLSGYNGELRAATLAIASGATLEAVGGGLLKLTADSITGASGLNLFGSGTIDAGSTLLNANHIRVGDLNGVAMQTLAIAGGLELADGAVIDLDLFGSGTSDKISAATLALGTSGTLNIGGLATGDYIIATATGGITGLPSGLAFTAGGKALSNRLTAALSIAANNLVLSTTVRNLRMGWAGGSGAWASGSGNWAEAGSPATPETRFLNGDSALFDTAGATTVIVADAGVTAGDVSVSIANAGDTLTFTGGAITADAASANASGTAASGAGKVYLADTTAAVTTGKLVKSGAGMLVLANSANTFLGGIDLAEGTLAFNGAAQLGVGASGTLRFTGNATLRADANILGASGTLATAVAIDPDKTATIDTQTHDVAYAGALSGGNTATLVKTGGGAFTMHTADSSAFAGNVNVDMGSFLLASGARLGGRITVTGSATAGGIGEFGGDVSVTSGVLRVGGDLLSSGTLTIGGALTLNNAKVAFSLFSDEKSDVLAFGPGGTIALSGSNTVDFHPTVATSGTFFITSATSLKNAGITIDNEKISNDSRQRAVWEEVTGGLALVYGIDTSRVMTWTNADADSLWSSDGSKNWIGSDSKVRFLNGDAVNFRGSTSGTVTVTGANVRVSSMDVDGSGDITIAGLGIQASGSFATGTEVSGSARSTGKLTKSGAGALIFRNGSGAFEGGIDVADGLIAFDKAAQLAVGSGAAIHFTGGATLRADADITAAAPLAGAITIDSGVVATFNTQAYTVTYTGALGGNGTLAKTGAGTLIYGGAVSLGSGVTTRIDAGLVKLGIAPSAVSGVQHTFDLNGGWLDLSDTGFEASGSNANNWEGLTFKGNAGGIIGSNDKITLRAGSIRFEIGSSGSASKQGVFVVVDAGAGGVATMTAANHYAGYTMLKSGTLRVSGNDQLGLVDLNREVIFEGAGGAALEITGNGFTTERAVELRQNGAVSVASASGTVIWNGTVTEHGGSYKLTKDGAGTLVIGGTMNHTGGTEVKAGTLRGSAAALHGAITNNAALIFDQDSGIGTYTGTVAGSGTVGKTGAGVLVLDGAAVINANQFNLDAGSLGGLGRINARLVNKSSGRIIGAKAAGAADYGTFTIGGDYVGEGGAVSLGVLLNDAIATNADKLVITGNVSGTTPVALVVATSTSSPSGPNATLIEVQGASTDGAFVLDQRYVNGIWEFAITKDAASGDWSLSATEIAPEAPAVLGVDASALLMGKASLDSLNNRLMFARSAPVAHKFELWTQGLQRSDKIVRTSYNGAKSDVFGVQVGGDWSRASGRTMFTAGVFYDYASGSMDHPDGRSTSDATSNAIGAYLAYKAGSWYVNGIMRGAKENYHVDIPRTPTFKMKGDSWAASVETGVTMSIDSEWKLEPQAQLTWQTHNIDDAFDSFGRRFTIDSADSFEGRFGIRLWEDIEWLPNLKITPYIRGSVIYEFKGDGRVIVDGVVLDNELGGGGGAVDAGFAMQLGRGWALSAQAAWYIGSKIEGYSLNLGLSFAW